MQINGIDFPNEIIDAVNEGKLVIFAGAGVSMGKPTKLPNFEELAKEVAKGTGQICQQGESCEAFLGRLKHQGIDVNAVAADKLSQLKLEHNMLHKNIVDLFPDSSKIKIVTTNYDNMFEQVLAESGLTNIKVYDTPALPLGNDVKGIIHIHGNVKEPDYMVLTDEDFGKAYLSDGYVSRFLVKLFETYTVLFIGYSYNDMIVRYLTRAMTKYQNQNRYLLTESIDGEWTELGIEPIVFGKGEYEVLNNSIHKLGEYIKRGLVDWKSSLSLIADNPPLDLAIKSELEFCLQDISKTRILADCIHGESWLWWLDENNVLNNLFNPHVELTDMDMLWLDWIVEKFVGKEDKIIKRLILKHNNQFNKQIADCIIGKIIRHDTIFSDSELMEYITIFEKNLTEEWTISRVLEVVMERKLYNLGWIMFQKLFDCKMVLKKGILFSDDDKVEFEHKILGDGYVVEHAWKQFGEVYIKEIPIDVFCFGIEFFKKIHFCYLHVGMVSSNDEPFSVLINTIDKGRASICKNAIFIVYEMITSAFQKIQETDKELTNYYTKQCIFADATLLKVIGIKLLRYSKNYSPDEKINLLLDNVSLFSFWEKEQIFMLIAENFDNLSVYLKNRILDQIEKGKQCGDEDNDAYATYNWAIWLQQNCDYNSRVSGIIENIKQKYPMFKPRENPELSMWSSEASWSGSISPISCEEMKGLEVDAISHMLKEYKGDDWQGPSRDGLLHTFADCIKDDFELTIKMADILVREFSYKSDVWDYFFRGLEQGNLYVEQAILILEKLMFDAFIDVRSVDISSYIKKIVDSEMSNEEILKYKDRLFDISIRLLDRDTNDSRYDGTRLIDKCFNCTTGMLTMSLLKMLSYDNNQDILEKYMKQFEKLLCGEMKEQAICVLVGQIAFMYSKNHEWCKDTLFPFLTSENVDEFKAAWEGVTWYSRRLYKELADEMIPIYLCAVNRLTELEGEAREGFVDLYTVLMIYAVENPLQEFMPELFAVAEEQDRKQLINSIDGSLRNMDGEQKKRLWSSWLKEYWENRVKNIPASLEEYEKTEMLDWILELDELYSQAVDIIILGPLVNDIPTTFWYMLREKGYGKKQPDATAKLISFLLESNRHHTIWGGEVKEITQTIYCTDEKNQIALQEAMLKKGIL